MVYISVTIPASTRVGKTVEATTGTARARVSLLSEHTLRIAPDVVCTVVAAMTEDGKTTISGIHP
jgi:hypothetical protein